MAACPNCGRRTLRTKDWVCQWCGYPLLYGGYKPIDKTYKELQEERSNSYQSEEPAQNIKYEPEPEPEPKPEPKWKQRKAPKPTYQQKPQTGPEPEIEPEPPPKPQPRPTYTPRPAPQPRQELLPRSRPEPVMLPKPEPAPQSEAEIAPEPEPVLRHAPRPEPALQPELLTVPSLESIKEGTQLTLDQIDALFRADSVGANAALKDKTLIIKGVVNKVFIRDHLDIRYMIITGTRRVVWSARCGFGKESAPQMSRLSEGQAVALRGKYEGYSKNIIFKDCELVG